MVLLVHDPTKLDCPLPCTQAHFNPVLNTFHGQEYNDTVPIFPYYSTIIVERKVESFVNTPMTFLSSIGGTMGLILGYSLLSVSLYVIDKMEKSVLCGKIEKMCN